jgi:predicted NAD/FAD-binding protein
LNCLQNLDTSDEVFVSLNPHERPDPAKTHKRVILAHPQFNSSTLNARDVLEETYQGKDGLWFCGAWRGYGFHEGGCRSSFDVATALSGVPIPWADDSTMVLPPPDLSAIEPKTHYGGHHDSRTTL